MVRLLMLVVVGLVSARAAPFAHAEATLDEIVHRAQAGFLGKVEAVNSRWGDASRSWMETDTIFRVEEVIVDDGQLVAGRNVTLTTWGGKIGTRSHSRAAQPTFVRDGRYVLLLNENYAKADSRSPLVGFNQGFFAVAPAPEGDGEIVVDHLGLPVVVVGGTKAIRLGEVGRQKAVAEPLSPAQLVAVLRGDLKRIQALRLPEAPALLPREGAKVLARPLGDSRRVANLAEFETRLPEIAAPKGFASPAAPRAARTARGGEGAQAKASRVDLSSAKFTTTRPSKLPMTINTMPKTDAFQPYGGVDENCLWLWNQYHPELFQIYSQPLDKVAYENGVNDVHGFLDEAGLKRRFGADGWNNEQFFVFYVHDGKQTIEADIVFNAALRYAVDDEAIYAGESTDFAFRRLAMRAFGIALGLDYNGFPSLMALPKQHEWNALHFPMRDDYLALRSLYPDLPRPKQQDLIVNLFHAPADDDWQQATFPAEVSPGGQMTIGRYLLENAGTAEAKQPLIDWYLCKARNWNDTFFYLGRSSYSPLPAGNYFYTNDDMNLQITVPQETVPGEYYLGAYLRDDPEFADAVFPFNSNSSFSRTRITVKR